MNHTIKQIVKGTTACMTYVCEGKVFYQIEVPNSEYVRDNSIYQLEIDSTTDEWKGTNLYPNEKAIHLMRWIRKGMKDGTLILIKR